MNYIKQLFSSLMILDEALKIGDRIAILRDGSMIQDGNPQEIIMNPADDYVSDFIKDINRARVIQAKSIMTPTKTKSSGPVVQEKIWFSRIYFKLCQMTRQSLLQLRTQKATL